MKSTQPVILNEAKAPASFPPAAIRRDTSASPQNDRPGRFVRIFVPVMLALGSLLVAPRSFAAASEPVDLGHNLSYLRVHSLPDSVPDLHLALSANRALVLDLRYTTTNAESLVVLRSDLAQHPREAPLFILISPATPAAVVEAIKQTPGGCISLGATSTRSARVVVKADPAADRRAYDALDAGTPVDALISGRIEKERFDEASLVEEFKNGNRDPEPPPGPDPTAPKSNGTATKDAPLVDRVLQRAVHLHQTMLALRRTAG
jgi:hypothetical protein